MGLKNPKIVVMCFVGVEPVIVMCCVGVESVWIASAVPPALPLIREAVSLNSVKSYVMVVAHSYQYVGYATSAFALKMMLVARPPQPMMVNFYSMLIQFSMA